MNQPTINLVIDKSNQNMVLPFLSKETSIDKMLTNVGEIIYIKNGDLIAQFFPYYNYINKKIIYK